MKSITNIVGIILIVVGIIALSYQGFTYTQREKVAQIGNINVTAETEKAIEFPPLSGGLCLVAGVVLIIVGRIQK